MLCKLFFLPLMINTFRLVLFALSQSKFWKRLEKILKAAGYFAMHLTPPTADQRGIVYVIYNDGEWLTYPDVWDPSQPSNAPSLVVPNGRYQPVDSIGKVWRENADVRNRLGWAYGPQSKFTGRMQLYLVQSGMPSGDYSHFFFIDHGKWGVALLLNSVDMGPNKWEVAGTY